MFTWTGSRGLSEPRVKPRQCVNSDEKFYENQNTTSRLFARLTDVTRLSPCPYFDYGERDRYLSRFRLDLRSSLPHSFTFRCLSFHKNHPMRETSFKTGISLIQRVQIYNLFTEISRLRLVLGELFRFTLFLFSNN